MTLLPLTLRSYSKRSTMAPRVSDDKSSTFVSIQDRNTRVLSDIHSRYLRPWLNSPGRYDLRASPTTECLICEGVAAFRVKTTRTCPASALPVAAAMGIRKAAWSLTGLQAPCAFNPHRFLKHLNYTCNTPVLNSPVIGKVLAIWRAKTSSARVLSGSMILSTQPRAAP